MCVSIQAAFPNAIRAGCTPGFLEMFKKNNALLEQIQKCLEDYLESKRMVFSRFFFLSNDELLEILSQTRNPLAVQPHMRKCFDAIQSLEFGVVPGSEKSAEGIKYTNDIFAMVSPEKERVAFGGKGLKARGNVEVWLCTVEEAMVKSLHALTKVALADYQDKSRRDWMKQHASQVVLTVSQIMWCSDVTAALTSENPVQALKDFERKCMAQLAEAASVSRESIPKLFRQVLGALITIDVHARDIITGMIEANVSSLEVQPQHHSFHSCSNDFERRISSGPANFATTGTTKLMIASFACPIHATSTPTNTSAQALASSSRH